jgi:hypothetical protein
MRRENDPIANAPGLYVIEWRDGRPVMRGLRQRSDKLKTCRHEERDGGSTRVGSRDRLKLDERWNFALSGLASSMTPHGESPREGDFCRPGETLPLVPSLTLRACKGRETDPIANAPGLYEAGDRSHR